VLDTSGRSIGSTAKSYTASSKEAGMARQATARQGSVVSMKRDDGRWVARRGNGRFDPERVATGLGWFSIGLGLAEILAPGKVGRAIGL
jgi:hypothetical protein